MKNFVYGVLVVSALASAVTLSAQVATTAQQAPQAAPLIAQPTVEEIVSKHVAAIGGKDAISKVKSVQMENSITMMGADNPSTTTIVDGVGYKNEMEFNGTKIVQCYTDKGGWSINPMTGGATATAMPDELYNTGKGQINVGDPLYDYAAKGSSVELMGKDGSAFKIKLTTKEKVESIYLVDSTSYLITTVLSKGKMQDQDVDITTKLSDYRKTELGYTMPYAIDLDLGGQFSLTVAIKKVEFNKTIDPAVFEMPK